MTLLPHFVQNELDASDADLDDRLSAFNWCNPFDHILPFSDGVVDAGDRAHLWGLFTGIAVAGAVAQRIQRIRGFVRNVGRLMNP